MVATAPDMAATPVVSPPDAAKDGKDGFDYEEILKSPLTPAAAEANKAKTGFWTKRRAIVAGVVGALVLAGVGAALGILLAPKQAASPAQPDIVGSPASGSASPAAGSGSTPPAATPAQPPAPPAPAYRTGRAAPKNCSLSPLTDRVTPPGTNRLEPPSASAPYIGFSLEWGWDRPVRLIRRLDGAPAIIGAFLQSYSPTTWDQDAFDLYVGAAINMTKEGDAGLVNPILNLALMPAYELDKLSAETMTGWAKQFARVNYQLGVPIMLRFAHEFNGNWNEYAQKPEQFIRKWREFTGIVRAHTNLTAMVWAPNVAVGYPYGSSQFSANPGTPDFVALDTNQDGKVDQLDDPYSPYWPGAEFVDWVAASIYWFGGRWPEVFNSPPPAGYLSTTIHGNSTESENYGQPAWDFHEMFARRYNKPMMIPESGVSFYSSNKSGPVPANEGELAIKQAWWRQTYNATFFKEFPLLKGVTHFEEAKLEERGNVTYLITMEPQIRDAFLKDLQTNPVTWASDVLQWECDGRVSKAPPKVQKRVLRSEL
ncbi:glycoside hydrolase superfamily [Hyaloraphidium curvatum]|nr:glycoside hydrolase superfamily [Hyaloraphidium curvatum]